MLPTMFTMVNSRGSLAMIGESLRLVAVDEHEHIDIGVFLLAARFDDAAPARRIQLPAHTFDVALGIGVVGVEGVVPHVDARQ